LTKIETDLIMEPRKRSGMSDLRQLMTKTKMDGTIIEALVEMKIKTKQQQQQRKLQPTERLKLYNIIYTLSFHIL